MALTDNARSINFVPSSLSARLLRAIGHQDWIRVGLRDRLLRHFAHPERVVPRRFEMEFCGYTYCGDIAQFIDWFAFFYGTYEKQELALMRDVLHSRKDPVCLDIGANVGHHTLFLSRHAATCHAFEPYEVVRRQLEEKIRQNRIENVFVHPVGLGARYERRPFNMPRDFNVGTGSFVETVGCAAAGQSSVEFQLVSGDNYLADRGVCRVDLIKVDIEGFEREALLGLSRTIHASRPHVFMEFSDATRRSFVDRRDLLSLFPSDYRVWSIRTDEPFLVFFNRPYYRLIEFDFDHPGTNLLVSPSEGLPSSP